MASPLPTVTEFPLLARDASMGHIAREELKNGVHLKGDKNEIYAEAIR
jgi:hypothetical protein